MRFRGSLKTGNKVRLQEVFAVVKQVVVSNEIRMHSMQHSSVVLNRSVLLRRLGPSVSPEAGAPFLLAPRGRKHLCLRRAGRSSQLKNVRELGNFITRR